MEWTNGELSDAPLERFIVNGRSLLEAKAAERERFSSSNALSISPLEHAIRVFASRFDVRVLETKRLYADQVHYESAPRQDTLAT